MKEDLTPERDAFVNVPKGLQILGDSMHPAAQILECNGTTREFGLILSPDQVQELIESRADALNRTGRVEFGPCITKKIILEFCDSPYLSKDSYASVIGELTQIFYYFKNELEWMADDQLISRMRESFDTICKGSVESLKDHVLEKMVLDLRHGCSDDADLSFGTDGFSGEEDEDE